MIKTMIKISKQMVCFDKAGKSRHCPVIYFYYRGIPSYTAIFPETITQNYSVK